MKRHRYLSTALLLLSSLTCLTAIKSAVNAQQSALPQLPLQDTVRIAEAYNLWKSLGERIWPGWTDVAMPLLYITPDYEYAIGFPKAMVGFRSLDQSPFANRSIQVRKRILDPNLAASFPIEGIHAIVIGTPKALEKSSSEWTLTAAHEMFHVLQYSRGAGEKIKSLALGSESDASWQLNFPFPYKDADVMRLIHLQSYPFYLAANDADEAELKYNAGVGVEAVRVYRSLLQGQSPGNQSYNYSQFQEWKEGIAFYSEYKIAEAAANGNYRPTEAFLQLPDYKSYQQVWDDSYKGRIFLVKHAGRASQSRTTFYHLGLGKGLLLDRLMPDWKTRYFAPNIWLNDLLMMALGQPSELKALSTGMTVPDFNLKDAKSKSVSLSQYRGKVVLIDFWQTWCPPCVEEIPYLKTLQQKYATQGLVILGISDRLDQEGMVQWQKLVHDGNLNYSTLIDEKGTIAGQYNVSGYPHKFVIDRAGRLVYDKRGFNRDDDELDKEILKALAGDK
jgi:peroxiredoxin